MLTCGAVVALVVLVVLLVRHERRMRRLERAAFGRYMQARTLADEALAEARRSVTAPGADDGTAEELPQ